MTNQYNNPEYAEVVKQMQRNLTELRAQYEVPENEKQDLTNIDRHYHSAEQRKSALERRAKQ